MVHPNLIGAAAASAPAASSASRSSLRLPSGSFRAGSPFPSLSSYDDGGFWGSRRRSSLAASLRRNSGYQTFPTAPPKTPGCPNRSFDEAMGSGAADDAHSDDDDEPDDDDDAAARSYGPTPLPLRQLALLALLSLAEQTALNSISPYLPTMVRAMDDIPEAQAGLYVGLLASAFALAQLTTNLMWGALCDRVGRKPVMLLGSALLAACFALFGFCTRYWHMVVVNVAMGLLNGNAAVVPTCLGELTDRSNQSRAFTWLPVMYSIGSITGPALGGLLVPDGADLSAHTYPFLLPNVASAALLVSAVVVLAIWFDETMDEADRKGDIPGFAWARSLAARLWRDPENPRERMASWSTRWPTSASRRQADPDEYDDDLEDDVDPLTPLDAPGGSSESRTLFGSSRGHERTRGDVSATDDDDKHSASRQRSVFRQLLNHRTMIVLATYLVFQLANISFNSLYPIFASAPGPTGRELSPETIGLLLSLAGLITILFQVSLFQPLKARMGNLRTYQFALFGLAASTALIPWIGSEGDEPPFGLGTGKAWLYSELGLVLVVKSICAVGGLSSVMLLINNSAPSNETLGTLNGIAQTLSAAGRSIGPFLSGGLFTLASQVRPRGELLAWGIFGGIALLGWFGSLTIRGEGLESSDWVGEDEGEDEAQESGDEEAGPGS